MSTAEDAAEFRKEYEECRALAAKARKEDNSEAAEQWLVFAQEWLKLAHAAEDLQRRDDTAIPTPDPA